MAKKLQEKESLLDNGNLPAHLHKLSSVSVLKSKIRKRKTWKVLKCFFHTVSEICLLQSNVYVYTHTSVCVYTYVCVCIYPHTFFVYVYISIHT